MTISASDWAHYRDKLAAISKKAADELTAWVAKKGGLAAIERSTIIDYAYGLAVKYGEGTAALAAQWYDEIAEVSGAVVDAAELASAVSYEDVATAINGALNDSKNESVLSGAIDRLVKMAGQDTILLNAARDGAEVAWIPSGDACAFCVSLAANGWQKAGKKQIKSGHAMHIHANCACAYAVRFGEDSFLSGYDPSRYSRMYYSASGGNSSAKINAMRRQSYAQNADAINAQKRAAYAKRVALKDKK